MPVPWHAVATNGGDYVLLSELNGMLNKKINKNKVPTTPRLSYYLGH